MEPTSFSTEGLPPAQQFDAWHEWFSPVIDISPQSPIHDAFLATNKTWNLGGLVVSTVSAPSAVVVRKKSNIANAPVDHWVLICCKHGMTKIETNATLLKASAGVPFIWSLGHKSKSERSDVNRVQVFLPRDMFPHIGPQLDFLCGSTVNTPLGAVLGEYIIALEQWLTGLPPELVPRLGTAVGSMIAACIAPSTERLDCASAEMDGFRMERVRQVVRMHLKSRSLTPEALCGLVGMSRSSLYRLFAYTGGVVRYIQRQRLLHAYKTLSDPMNRTSIFAIAEELCFADSSSFSRAFRQEFGCAPRDVRSAAARGHATARAGRPRQRPDIACFADILRSYEN